MCSTEKNSTKIPPDFWNHLENKEEKREHGEIVKANSLQTPTEKKPGT